MNPMHLNEGEPVRETGEEREHALQEPAARDVNPTAPGDHAGQQGDPGNNTEEQVEELTESIQEGQEEQFP